MKWIFVGLGNPGGEYDGTRHNTGRMALESYAKREKLKWREDKKAHALVAKSANETSAAFILPNTFMNKSGSALLSYVKSVNAAHHTIVVYDDLDLPLGKIKLSYNRGNGGHNGLKSIERAVKTQEFWRIRIGVSPSTASGKTKKPVGEEAVIKFILSSFTPAQRDELKKVYKQVNEAIGMIIAEGPERAMNYFN
jgi:PTH1 family peptidyl-tRNA hydrolase